MRRLFALAGFALTMGVSQPALACGDRVPRTAIVSAFEPEWTALKGLTHQKRECRIGGVGFVTGTLGQHRVVLFLSGVSMVNAAMTTQSALDHFHIKRLIFTGIAGATDTTLAIGDVAVPEAWATYLEANFARETPDGFRPFRFTPGPYPPNFGMIHPQGVHVTAPGGPLETKLWFSVDPELLRLAGQAAAQVKLSRCAASGQCLDHPPKIVVGGKGVSASIFLDNAKFRDYLASAFSARVADMESSALAQTAYANGVPFIVFRSVSDLAGGGEGENQMRAFMALAAEHAAQVTLGLLVLLPRHET